MQALAAKLLPESCFSLRVRVACPFNASLAQLASSCAQYNSFVATYHVENFGCRATQADGAAIERQLLGPRAEARRLRHRGRSRRPEYLHRDRVRRSGRARRHSPHSSRKSRRKDPGYRLLRAARSARRLSAIPGVSLVVGNSHKHELADYVCPADEQPSDSCRWLRSRADPESSVIVGDIFAHTELMAAPVFEAGSLREDAPQSQGAGRLQ